MRRDGVSGTNETPTREELLRRMWSLAGARVNDAVKLAFLPEEQMGAIGRLEQEREGGRLEAFYEDLDGGGDK